MGKGDFIKKPDRRFKLLVTIQILWVGTLLVLALWWGNLLRQQSDEIANLQTQLGQPESQVQSRLDRTERMITGESGAFIALILVTNAVLLAFFIRDTRRSRSLEAFFASLTHELRTPLTSIRLQAETLKDIEDDPRHMPFINRLLEDVSRLEGQVQQTLELARIEAGSELSTQPVRIKSFLLNKVIPQYAYHESRMKLDFTAEEAFVFADPAALNIIFRNLFDNAIKYSSSLPAQISVQSESDEHRYYLNFIHKNSSFQGEQARLGKLFYRGKNSQGAGVGLYLISTLMSKFKGTADFKPKESEFATYLSFRVEKGEIANV